MDKKVLAITAKSDTVTILEGKALEEKAPVNLNLAGTIESVKEFLTKRLKELDLMKTHVIFDKEKMFISLCTNETDVFKIAEIIGKIKFAEEFSQFKINTGESWTCFDLSDFIKMHRSFFETKEVAGKLVNQLRDFKAKVERDVEQIKDDRANYTVKRAQSVKSNLPDSFVLKAKIFKGVDALAFPVEINIHPDTLNCILISPDANDYIEETVCKIINKELDAIKELAPEIVIIEQ